MIGMTRAPLAANFNKGKKRNSAILSKIKDT